MNPNSLLTSKSVDPIPDFWSVSPEEREEINIQFAIGRLRRSGIPRKFRKSLRTWETRGDDRRAQLLTNAWAWVHAFGGSKDEGQNLIFCGVTGSGKTALACAMGYELIFRGKRVRCEVLSMLWRNLRSTWGVPGATEFDFLDLLEGNHMVILDDLGDNRIDRLASPWKAESLRDIVNIITENDQRFIVTTNHKRAELEEWLHDASVCRRIFEKAKTIDLFEALPSFHEEGNDA